MDGDEDGNEEDVEAHSPRYLFYTRDNFPLSVPLELLLLLLLSFFYYYSAGSLLHHPSSVRPFRSCGATSSTSLSSSSRTQSDCNPGPSAGAQEPGDSESPVRPGVGEIINYSGSAAATQAEGEPSGCDVRTQ